jgi:hypothetical protein
VRYIHLNPLRAKEVKDLTELERYPWCGQTVLMGKRKHPWQDRDYVLSRFEKREGDGRRAYKTYVKQGVLEGRRPDLVGGGLIRYMGG